MTDSRFSALYLDENIKKRDKFQFFGLRISNSHLFLAYSHCLLLRLISSDKIDISDRNRWKSIEIEPYLPKSVKSIKIENHKNFCYRLSSIFDISRLISIEIQSILSSVEIIDL